MDIHRCRFVPYPASAINAVAFSHPHLSTGSKHSKTTPSRLAIGRANGDIEIWNPMHGTWLHELTIPGGQDRSIEGLAWIVGDDEELDGGRAVSHGRMRLFSIGYTNTITEWDLEKACAKRHASGQHGDIWCLATQPKPSGTAGAGAGASTTQRLVGGTMDGCLVLYATEDDDLRFQRLCRTHKKNVKMTSIAFQSRQIAVVGCSDSTIRVFDVRHGAVLHAMTLGRDLLGGAKDVIVWSVRCLPSGDIVSGDSTGQLCIWDGRTYTQAQRIQGHSQDLLSLAVSADGSAIISGGMDRRVVLYREMASRASRWAKVWHRRYHQHDVKAMAAFEAKGISVVVAGGPDATPVVLPLQKSGSEHHRSLSHLPQTVPVASAPDARLVLAWWERQVHIWAFDTPISQLLGQAASEADVDRNRRLVGRILLKGDANITTAAISADGSLVVVATSTEIKAFHLAKNDASNALTISKVTVPSAIAAQGATSLAIAPNGRWVALARGVDSHVTLLRVITGHDDEAAAAAAAKPTLGSKALRLSRLKRDIPRYELVSGLGRYDRRITHMVFSPDSRMLAAADLAGYIDTWVLRGPDGQIAGAGGGGQEKDEEEEGADDALSDASSSSDESDGDDDGKKGGKQADDDDDNGDSERWVRNPRARQLPKLLAAPVVLSFAPDVPGAPSVAGPVASHQSAATDYVLLAVNAAARLLVFHPLRARLVPWLRRLSPACLPLEYRNIRDLAKGVLWQGPRMWLYGASFVFMIDTSVEPAAAAATTAVVKANGASSSEPAPVKRKRKRGDDTGAGGKMEQGWLEPQRVQKVASAGGTKDSGWVDVEMQDVDDHQHTDDDDEDESDEGENDDDDNDNVNGGENKLHDTQTTLKKQLARQDKNEPHEPQTRWWHTFKYRPILGVVPLAAPAAAAAAAGDNTSAAYAPLEVALVERPGWDMDLPARYDGDK